MFEKLIEKILLAKLGKFIAGLDKDQLKVALWSGDITLENVRLKPDALLMLQLPLVLALGVVKRLVVKVPWTRLGSSSVQISLEGLYAIVAPQPKGDWEYSEEGEVLKKKENLEAHELRRKQLLEHKALSPEEEGKQRGFVEKLTAKVVDNLKICVKDLHLRFEHELDGRPFSAGIVLEDISCFTTNSEWQRVFTDRATGQEIFKLLNVSGLSFY